MRLTYTDLKNQFYRNINLSGASNVGTINDDFNANLGTRYQLILAKLKNFHLQKATSISTVANQQYYEYPIDLTNIETVVVTVGSVNYPLDVINNQGSWDILNAIQVSASAIPQFFLPRSPQINRAAGGGFGIWPIPQDVYTITFNYHYRDRNLTVEDYTDGSVALTNGSTTLTGTTTVFTPAMVGRWFTINDPTSTGQGYWYLITNYVSATQLTLYSAWQGATGTGLSYRIGETPLIPEEGHRILCDGATADYYGGMRKDKDAIIWFNNLFWTGDPNNALREEGNPQVTGGLLGLINRYGDRSDTRLVQRGRNMNPLNYQVWATHLS